MPRPIQPSAFSYLLPTLVQSGDNTQTSGANGWTPGGGFSIQIPDNTRIGGNPRGRGAVDLQTQRTAATQVASGAGSFVMGSNNTASGAQSFVTGIGNTASGAQSFAIGDSNTASGAQSFATGFSSTASGTYAVAMGFSTASNDYSAAIGAATSYNFAAFAAGSGIASGNYAAALAAGSASGTYSFSTGQATASNTYSVALGRGTASQQAAFSSGYASAAQIGKWAHAGPILTVGDLQTGMIVLFTLTTTNTTVVLTSDGVAAGTTNQLIASTNRAMAFTGELIGKQSGSANIAAYTITGTLVNNAGTVTMPTGTLTAIGTDTIGLDTAPALAADNTNKGLTVTSGAKTTTNIRWVCTLRSTEVVYA